jgi:hypothetical protein
MFRKGDLDAEGLLWKGGVCMALQELQLDLPEQKVEHFTEVHFQYLDRTRRSKLSITQFMTCAIAMLYTYELTQVCQPSRMH